MFALKTIHLEKKVSNENQIILLFDLDSSCPCLYPMLYTMKFLRFQSISTQHADLIAIKFWYEFWYDKFATSFCESFYSTSYNFEIILVEIDNFIVYLENNKKIDSNLIRLRNTDHTNYTTIGHRIRSFLKFYNFLIDEYLSIQSQPQLTLKEIQKIKENLNKYMTIKKKIINNFSKSNKTIKSEIKQTFKSMNQEMIKGLYSIISPSNCNKYNKLNPFRSKNVQLRNFLHGKKLADILDELLDYYGGFEGLSRKIEIRCFCIDPSVKSSLRFLRTTPWAREKVESLYLYVLRQKAKQKS